MNASERILARARSLFDAVGVATDPATGDTILVLGLVSTPDRDLDDFASDGAETTIMRGFTRHASGVAPRHGDQHQQDHLNSQHLLRDQSLRRACLPIVQPGSG